jgi:hypothetical protein
MVSDWQDAFWYAAIVMALAGGGASIVAFVVRSKGGGGDETARKAHILYLVSYIFMSVSIFFIAFRGLLQ